MLKLLTLKVKLLKGFFLDNESIYIYYTFEIYINKN